MAELPNRVKQEQALARKLAKLFRNAASGLETVLGDPPRMSNVPSSFWADLGVEFRELMVGALALVWAIQSTKHGKKLTAEKAASSVSGNVSSLTTAMIKNMKDEIKQKQKDWQEQHGRGTLTPAKLRASISGTLGQGRAEGISRTAITDISVNAAEDATGDQDGGVEDGEAEGDEGAGDEEARGGSIQSPNDKWFNKDYDRVCPICLPLNNKKRKVWARKFPLGPPAHPNCNCYIFYFDLDN